MTTPRRHFFAALMVCLLPLGACSALPSSGPPQPFDVNTPTTGTINFVAGAPIVGASPDQLLEGFLRACAAGSSDDFETARLFLSKASQRTWKPRASIQIYSTDSTPRLDIEEHEGRAVVTVNAPAVASVDAEGTLTEAEATAEVQTRFQLIQEDGEWRINTPDDGIILSRASFTAAFESVNLYFPSPDGNALIPDPRWYPRKRVVSHMVEGLLKGPHADIASAVASAIPEGARLGGAGASVKDNVATVVLEGAQAPPEAERTLLMWQVATTLKQSALVADVSLTVGGESITAASLPSGPNYRLDSAIASTNEGIGIQTGSTFTPQPFPEGHSAPLPRLAMSPVTGDLLAWASDSTLTLWERGRGTSQSIAVAQPSWPSIDRYNWAWTASRDKGVLTLTHLGGTTSPLTGSTYEDEIHALRVSPDGARAVMLRRVGQAQGLWLATIARDQYGTPIALSDLRPLARLSEGVVDVSWASSTMVVALHQHNAGHMQLEIIPLGGFIQSLAAPENSLYVTAGLSPASLYVTTADGKVWARSSAIWLQVPQKIVGVRFPG